MNFAYILSLQAKVQVFYPTYWFTSHILIPVITLSALQTLPNEAIMEHYLVKKLSTGKTWPLDEAFSSVPRSIPVFSLAVLLQSQDSFRQQWRDKTWLVVVLLYYDASCEMNSQQSLGCRAPASFDSVSTGREQNKEDRVKSISSILQVKEMGELGDVGWVAISCCCCPETLSELCMPGYHPASPEFLSSNAYAVESSGVGLCQ